VRPIIALLFSLLSLAQTPIAFEDVTAQSGIACVLDNRPTARKLLPETMPGGIAVFDYNNDGRMDLLFTNGAGATRLYRNDGRFHFTDVTSATGFPTAGYTMGAAAADFDNDGFADVLVTGVGETRLYRNAGGRSFRDVTVESGIANPGWSVAAAWLDYDRDGLLDLFVANYVQWSATLNPLCHDPSGRLVVYCHPREFKGAANRLFHNLGNGRFKDVSDEAGIGQAIGKGMSVAVADYDHDGFPDIFVTNDSVPNFLFHNLRNGRFEEVALEAGVALTDDGKPVSAMGADFRDIDNNGLPDLVFTALTGETFPMFRNAGHGQFQDATAASGLGRLSHRLTGWGISIADLNNDGWKDILTANGHVTDNIAEFSGDRYKLSNSVFQNQRDGTFAAGPSLGVARANRGAVVADLDNDGRLDIVVSALGETPRLWRNTSASAHWLDLKLNALGAVVRIGKQTNAMTSAIGYASSALIPVHFGLGDQSMVPLITIEWPSGHKQELRNVRADQTITVTESSSHE
jgi:hypothetical protein